MRKLKLLAGAVLLTAAIPAAAQYSTQYRTDSGYNYGNPRDRIERLDRLVRDRRVTQSVRYHIERELSSLRSLERQYSRNGYTRYERDEMNRRLVRLEERVRRATGTGIVTPGYDNDYAYDRDYDDRLDRDGNGWDDRYDRDGDGVNDTYDRDRNGWDDRYDRDGDGVNDTYDRDRNGWDDRYDRDGDGVNDTYDRDRNGWDDRYDQDGDGWNDRNDWDESQEPWGTRTDDRYPQGFDPVPDRYRTQYRDTDRHYYRYRQGYVYQIDRTSGRTLNTYWVGQ